MLKSIGFEFTCQKKYRKTETNKEDFPQDNQYDFLSWNQYFGAMLKKWALQHLGREFSPLFIDNPNKMEHSPEQNYKWWKKLRLIGI